jgi:hypothetical protein
MVYQPHWMNTVELWWGHNFQAMCNQSYKWAQYKIRTDLGFLTRQIASSWYMSKPQGCSIATLLVSILISLTAIMAKTRWEQRFFRPSKVCTYKIWNQISKCPSVFGRCQIWPWKCVQRHHNVHVFLDHSATLKLPIPLAINRPILSSTRLTAGYGFV